MSISAGSSLPPDGRVMGEYGSSASDVSAEFIWLNPNFGDAAMFGGDDGLGGDMPIALANAAPGGGTTLNWVRGGNERRRAFVFGDAQK